MNKGWHRGARKNVAQDARHFVDKGLRLFPDLRWEKEVRWERTAMKERRTWVKVAG